MKEVGASKRMGHIIEGESLLNDGSAYVFFLVFQDLLVSPDPRSGGEVVGYLFELVGVACLVGIGFGLVTTIILAVVYRYNSSSPPLLHRHPYYPE
jgi:NhaP-type Na+/H+ or K+/H+ antiporter